MPVLKAVIDTNVMVSVAFPKGELTRELRDMIADGAFTLVTSKESKRYFSTCSGVIPIP